MVNRTIVPIGIARNNIRNHGIYLPENSHFVNGFFPFRTVAERFHLIDSPTRTIYIPLGKGAELVEELRSGNISQKLFRKLGQYGVSVYEQHFTALENAGDLEILENGAAILLNSDLYSTETGLSLEADNGKALFV